MPSDERCNSHEYPKVKDLCHSAIKDCKCGYYVIPQIIFRGWINKEKYGLTAVVIDLICVMPEKKVQPKIVKPERPNKFRNIQ